MIRSAVVLRRLKATAVFLGMMAVASIIFYVLPPHVLTIGYSISSFTTGVLLICMLQSKMTDSSLPFRIAICGLAAGCLATAFTPFMHDYQINPWGFLRGMSLLAVVALMRLRQIKPDAKPARSSLIIS